MGKAALAVLLLAPAGAGAGTVTITALGDSLTHGYGLAQGDGFVPQLQEWLTDQGADVRVINAGMSGDTTAGARARVEWALADGPDAVIVALGGNDVLRGLPADAARENLAAILATAAPQPVLLVGIAAPGNFGAAYQAEFDTLYADLAQEFDTLLYPDFLGPLRDAQSDAAARSQWVQADGIHPNRDGVARIVADMGPLVLDLIARAAP